MVVLNIGVGLREESDQESALMMAGYINQPQLERLRSQSKERCWTLEQR